MSTSVTRLDKYDNSSYQPGSIFLRVLWTVCSGLFFQTWVPWPSGLKRTLLRVFGARVGRGVVIKPRVSIKYPWKLSVGHHVWIGEQVWIDSLDQVTIGNHVCISQGALLLCGNHNYKKSTFDLMTGRICLEDGVWIGAKAIVGSGVTCGSHSVLALGSVALNDLEAWTIFQGNPAVSTRERQIDI